MSVATCDPCDTNTVKIHKCSLQLSLDDVIFRDRRGEVLLIFYTFQIFHSLFDKVSLKSLFLGGRIVEISLVLASSLLNFLSICFEIKLDAIRVDFRIL